MSEKLTCQCLKTSLKEPGNRKCLKKLMLVNFHLFNLEPEFNSLDKKQERGKQNQQWQLEQT